MLTEAEKDILKLVKDGKEYESTDEMRPMMDKLAVDGMLSTRRQGYLDGSARVGDPNAVTSVIRYKITREGLRAIGK